MVIFARKHTLFDSVAAAVDNQSDTRSIGALSLHRMRPKKHSFCSKGKRTIQENRF